MGQHVLTISRSGNPLVVTCTKAQIIDQLAKQLLAIYPRIIDLFDNDEWRKHGVTPRDGRRRRAQFTIRPDPADECVLLPSVVLSLLLEQGWRLHSMDSDLTVLILE